MAGDFVYFNCESSLFDVATRNVSNLLLTR